MTLQEKIQKGLDCWCERVDCKVPDDCRKYGCPYADSTGECSTDILHDVDRLLLSIAVKDGKGAERKQPITPDMVQKKLIDDISDQCTTAWERKKDKDELLRDAAYIAGLVDMANNVCKMLGGDGDA